MKKFKHLIPYMFVLCASITDPQYNDFIRRIVFSGLQTDSNDLESVLIKRAAFVVDNSTNTAAVTAGKCFMFDLYQLDTGIVVSSNTSSLALRHGFRHWIDRYVPGEGFLP